MSDVSPLETGRWAGVAVMLASSILFASGCGSGGSQLFAINESGQRLENVTASSGNKSFTFGVLIDGGEAGYMTADQTFGRNFPEDMTLKFETVDGASFERTIKLANSRTRKLKITIDDKLNAQGVFE